MAWQKLIDGNRASVRAAVFMGAMIAARHNSQLKALRDELVALIATIRKLLPILNAILRAPPWMEKIA